VTDANLKPRSHALIDGANRAGARAMLRACGLKDDDFQKPLIGVANTWIEIGPCNYHLRELAEHVKQGIRAAGGTPLEFNTVSISDGITMGTEGMRASLVSREVITDSIELVTRGNLFDALIILVGGCVLIATVFRKEAMARAITGGVVAIAMLAVATWVVANYAARQKDVNNHPIVPPFHWHSHVPLLLITVFALGIVLTTGVGAIAER